MASQRVMKKKKKKIQPRYEEKRRIFAVTSLHKRMK